MSVISEIVQNYHDFQRDYVIYPINPIYTIKNVDYFNLPIFSFCDVFIHQAIRINNRYGEEFASEKRIACLKKDCLVVAVPNVYQLPTCFFPQYAKKPELRKKTTFFFRDSIIDTYYEQGFGPKEIAKRYNDVEYRPEDIQREFDLFIEKVKSRESEWDIKVVDFIVENYQRHQLFYDPNHPTNYFFQYVAMELLKILLGNVDKSKLEKIQAITLDTYEMPVCFSCKKALGMQIPQRIIRKKGAKIRHKKMDLQEYVLQYVSMQWSNEDLSQDLRNRSKRLYIWLKFTDLFYLATKVPQFISRKIMKKFAIRAAK